MCVDDSPRALEVPVALLLLLGSSALYGCFQISSLDPVSTDTIPVSLVSSDLTLGFTLGLSSTATLGFTLGLSSTAAYSVQSNCSWLGIRTVNQVYLDTCCR